MHRTAHTLGLAASVVLGLAASVVLGLAGPAAAAPPRDQLRAFQCQRALEPAARAVSVTSVMRPVSRTQAMAVRFELLSRAKGAAGYSRVNGRDLGRWISPADRTLGTRPGDVWIFNKPVVELPAPAAYRFRVSFRWTGAHRRVLATAVKTSATCREPELRPDLAIRRIDKPVPTTSGLRDLYTVTVANDGATAAGPFTVELAAPNGSPPARAQIDRLAAHAAGQVTLRGPLCVTGAPTVTVDPLDAVPAIDDFNRANNQAVVSCTGPTQPFPGS